MKDEQLEEKFRELTLHLERLETDVKWTGARFGSVESKLTRLTDEFTLPSGKLTQRFSKLEQQIRELGGNGKTPSKAKKRR